MLPVRRRLALHAQLPPLAERRRRGPREPREEEEEGSKHKHKTNLTRDKHPPKSWTKSSRGEAAGAVSSGSSSHGFNSENESDHYEDEIACACHKRERKPKASGMSKRGAAKTISELEIKLRNAYE